MLIEFNHVFNFSRFRSERSTVENTRTRFCENGLVARLGIQRNELLELCWRSAHPLDWRANFDMTDITS